MEFLRLLEGIRTPIVSAFMAAITYVGDETVFMVIAITLFWCVSKRQGYYLFAVSLAGTAGSQWLKLVYRIPRPWVLDPGFTIVEAAREGAGGYSFPSGHTQGVVGTFGALALANKQKWLRAVCVVMIVLVPFSRMYLGVHTPLDVGVAFVGAAALAVGLYPCFRDEERFRKTFVSVYTALLVFLLGYVIWVNTARFPADVDAENLSHGIKNGWSLLGTILGLIVAYIVDEKKLHFDVKAPLLGQICKLVLGLALVVGLRVGLKAVLPKFFQGSMATDLPDLYLAVTNGLRYFLMVVFAGCVWPLTFPFFAKLGEKRS